METAGPVQPIPLTAVGGSHTGASGRERGRILFPLHCRAGAARPGGCWGGVGPGEEGELTRNWVGIVCWYQVPGIRYQGPFTVPVPLGDSGSNPFVGVSMSS